MNKQFSHNENFKSSIAFMSLGRVLITDRLHTSIFAFLLHKPHVFLEQTYGKFRIIIVLVTELALSCISILGKVNATRRVAFQSSVHCQDQEKMRYDSAQSLEEAVMKAEKMLTTYF